MTRIRTLAIEVAVTLAVVTGLSACSLYFGESTQSNQQLPDASNTDPCGDGGLGGCNLPDGGEYNADAGFPADGGSYPPDGGSYPPDGGGCNADGGLSADGGSYPLDAGQLTPDGHP